MFALLVVLALGGAAVLLLKRSVYVCRPNEVLVVAGRRQPRIVTSGWILLLPIERATAVPLSHIPVSLRIEGAYTKGGVSISLAANAVVAVSTDAQAIGMAIERFLGRDRAEIGRVAKETLEGHLRAVVAEISPEELHRQRLRIAQQVAQRCGEDLTRLGLELKLLNIVAVADSTGLLDAHGREEIATVLRDAELARRERQILAITGSPTQSQAAAVAAPSSDLLNEPSLPSTTTTAEPSLEDWRKRMERSVFDDE